jgi:hypothetical protein
MSLNDVVSVTVNVPFLLSTPIQPHMIVRERAVFCDRGCCSKNVQICVPYLQAHISDVFGFTLYAFLATSDPVFFFFAGMASCHL